MADAPPQPPAPPSKEQQLSIEEQQIIAEIQELQRHLRELKAQEGHDDDEELVVPTTKTRTPRRVLVVANRLPIRARRDARTARWTFDTAPGGLATALRGIATDVEFVWVGWLGADVLSRRPAVLRRLHAIDARRLRESRRWVVSFSILRPFGPRSTGDAPRRCRRQKDLEWPRD